MAEVAAAVWAAEEVVSTGVQIGAAGYAVAKPTMPVKATWSQLATTPADASGSSLTRSHHTVTVFEGKAYIFGGRTGRSELATTNIHAVTLSPGGAQTSSEYQVLPALPAKDGAAVPVARSDHSACAHGRHIAVYGGLAQNGKPVEESAKIWLYDVENSVWDATEPVSHPERIPPPRSHAKLFSHDGNLVLYGGKDSTDSPLADTWHFNCHTRVWNQLPHAPAATSSAAFSGDTLYLISGSEDNLSCRVHWLDVKTYAQSPPTWESSSFPTNPLTPGPRPRDNGGLVPVSTGFGRNFLLYFFGDRQISSEQPSNPEKQGDPPQWSDLWTLQLPSSDVEVHASTSMHEAVKPAKIKDQIRSKAGADTGKWSWSEVEVQPPGDLQSHEGKVHPGPRSCFGCSQTEDGTSVILWGGIDGSGQQKGDGWVIHLE